MAQHRCFAKTIIDSDAFLDMPLSTQALYFHLSMRADDEGFINNPKKIQRMVGASDDDLKVLISKHFIIPFESGIVVIKHWRIHNYIRKDRINPTAYEEEKSMLKIKENGAYTLSDNQTSDICLPNDGQTADICPTDDCQMSAQDKLSKDKLSKDKLSKDKLSKDKVSKVYSSVPELNDAILDFIDYRKKIKKPMTDKAVELMVSKLNEMTADTKEQIAILNQSILNGWQGIFPLRVDANGKKTEGRLDWIDAI